MAYAPLFAVLLAAVSAQALPRQDDVVPGEYIVVLKNQGTHQRVLHDMDAFVDSLGRKRTELQNVKVWQCERDSHGRIPQKCHGRIDMETFKAVIVNTFDSSAVEALKQHPMVDYVEQSRVAYPAATCVNQQSPPSWGIDYLDGSYNYNFYHDDNGGHGATVYVLDGGINKFHYDFESRAFYGTTTCQGQSAPCQENVDTQGHGTHVAGTVISKSYGVAKKATVISVKCLNDQNWGSWAGIIAAVNWAVSDWKSKGKKPSVINMSIAGGKQTSMNSAVKAAWNEGLLVVIAAGNNNANACSYSPASEPNSVTVGNHDKNSKRRYDSNYGTCLDIWGPGDKIVSLSHSSNTGSRTMSGTSMASPHVAGMVAVYLADNPFKTPSQIKSWLSTNAKPGIVDGKTGSPDKIAVLKC